MILASARYWYRERTHKTSYTNKHLGRILLQSTSHLSTAFSISPWCPKNSTFAATASARHSSSTSRPCRHSMSSSDLLLLSMASSNRMVLRSKQGSQNWRSLRLSQVQKNRLVSQSAGTLFAKSQVLKVFHILATTLKVSCDNDHGVWRIRKLTLQHSLPRPSRQQPATLRQIWPDLQVHQHGQDSAPNERSCLGTDRSFRNRVLFQRDQ
jgi:hypothetical protein